MSFEGRAMRPSPSLVEALCPLGVLLSVLLLQVTFSGDFRPHLALLSGVVAGVLSGRKRGYGWSEISDGMFRSVSSGMAVLSILLLLGVLVASWVLAGTIPFLVFMGLSVILPGTFLPVAFWVSFAMGTILGSGMSAIGTVGVALAGIGHGFGIPPWLTAGAIVSGAFFGNRTSPISDTSILAPQVAGIARKLHVRNMVLSSVGPLTVATLLYFAVGYLAPSLAGNRIGALEILDGLESCFVLSPLSLIPVVVVLFLVLRGAEPLPAFFWSAVSALAVSVMIQGWGPERIFSVLLDGGGFSTGSDLADQVVNRGGLSSMAMLLVMVSIALALGGVMETVGSMDRIVSSVLRRGGGRSLDALAIGTTALISAGAGSGSVGIVLAGRMFRPVYESEGRERLFLSRAVVEGSILIVPLVPWAACGAFVVSALGLSVNDGAAFLYIPCSFSCILPPLWAAVAPFLRR